MKARPSTPPTSRASSLEKETLAAFSAWRQSAPIGFRRMSESLWGAAIRLAVATSVYQAARLLRLDFSQLKKRVLSSSEKTKGSSDTPGNDIPTGRSPVVRKAAPLRKSNHPPAGRSSAPHSSDHGSFSVSNHGFVEVSALGGVATGPQPLAEIHSPAGYTLRLFSAEASRIVEAFMKS